MYFVVIDLVENITLDFDRFLQLSDNWAHSINVNNSFMTLNFPFEENFCLIINKIKRLLQPLVLRLKPFRFHLLILLLTVVYYLLAPVVYGNYFIKYGKPVKLDVDLPMATKSFIYTIDSNETITIEGRKSHQFLGWVFLADEQNQSKFEKYLVLNSELRTYFFEYDVVDNPGVQEAYIDLGLDVLSSGFQALISGDQIKSGTYNIGFLFRNQAEDKLVYSVTNRYFFRTPNQFFVIMGAEPTINASGHLDEEYKKYLQDGSMLDINPMLPTPTSRIKNFVEIVSRELNNGKSYTKIVGWAFMSVVDDQATFDRIIVLKSKQGIYYFPTTRVERADVHDAFKHLNLDNGYSGFETYIVEEALPPGNYEIGIIFQDKDQDIIYFTKTSSILTWHADQFELQGR